MIPRCKPDSADCFLTVFAAYLWKQVKDLFMKVLDRNKCVCCRKLSLYEQVCAGEKLLEKNAIGSHALSMRCMTEAPQPKFEASETSTVSASERGWAKVAWLHRESFRLSNATTASLWKTKGAKRGFLPCKSLCRGATMVAKFGIAAL